MYLLCAGVVFRMTRNLLSTGRQNVDTECKLEIRRHQIETAGTKAALSPAVSGVSRLTDNWRTSTGDTPPPGHASSGRRLATHTTAPVPHSSTPVGRTQPRTNKQYVTENCVHHSDARRRRCCCCCCKTRRVAASWTEAVPAGLSADQLADEACIQSQKWRVI